MRQRKKYSPDFKALVESGSRRIRHPGLGRLVQSSAAARPDRAPSAGRGMPHSTSPPRRHDSNPRASGKAEAIHSLRPNIRTCPWRLGPVPERTLMAEIGIVTEGGRHYGSGNGANFQSAPSGRGQLIGRRAGLSALDQAHRAVLPSSGRRRAAALSPRPTPATQAREAAAQRSRDRAG